jgi:Tol biopolymer transport system component
MNGITHKQAMQWIDRQLDGMLSESQLAALEDHLKSCDSCRAYATDMDGLSSHLQNEFHRRWDEKAEPSRNVMTHVTKKARTIPVINRISSSAKLLAGAIALIILAVAINFVVSRLERTSAVANETVDNTRRPEDRLLAFTSKQGGNSDIYTVHADGSELVNITNHPAFDSNPFWSPDGKRIAFERDQDGFRQIYMMDADGSNVMQLTTDEVHHWLPHNIDGTSNPWSPDGSKLLFLQQGPDAETSTLHSIDIHGGNTVRFASGTIAHGFSWSPNGNYIGYVLNESPTPGDTFVPGIYVADATGSGVMAVSKLIAPNESINNPSYYWSRGGSSIIFTVHRHTDEGRDQWIAYEASLVDGQLIEKGASSGYMADWWEGTSFIRGLDGPLTLTWLRADGTFDELKPLDICQSTENSRHGFVAKRSPNGSQIVNVMCPNDEMWFYYVNSDATIIKPLLDSPIPAFAVDNSMSNMTWSPDDQFIAISLVSPRKSSLYILNVNDNSRAEEITLSDDEFYTVPSWQPVANEEVVEENPIPEPTPSPLTFSLTVQEVQQLAGFNVLVPTYLPEGYEFQGAAYNPQSDVVTLQYISSSGDLLKTGTIGIYQKRGDFPDFSKQLGLSSQSHATPVPIGSMTGEFTRGAWVYDSPDTTIPRWEESADYYSLSWQNDGMSFIVDFLGDHVSPPISLDELVAIAESLKSKPTAQQFPSIGTNTSNGEWITFIGGQTVPDPVNPTAFMLNQNIYMIRPNGSGLTNLTGFPAHYFSLQWSPDGQHLLFVRENSVLNKINIMRHYASPGAGYGEVTPTISDPDHYGYSWSPNSDKIVFADSSSGNYDIYTVYADGRNNPKLTQLTDDPAQDVGFAWSPDGSQIAFQRLDGEKLSIYVMNEDGSDQREVAHGSGQVKLEWSHDGTSIYASSTENNWLECEGCIAKPAIYRIQLDGSSVQQVYYEEDASKVAGWYVYDMPQNMLYFMRINRPNFVEFWGTWFRADGTSVTEIGELDPDQTCKTTTGNILHESISPNPRFSIISNFCAGGFDLYLADREPTRPEERFIHLLQLPLDTEGQGGDFATLPIGWSPDGRWLIYDNGRGTIYLLDIEGAIQDPEAALTPLMEPILYTGADGQLYQSSETISVFDLVWQPIP